ncbi:MAG TPA: cation:proton antiporter [Desulfuromonadales bacterium]|jgi:Kef-type K+ transport system membrane component KefB/mannitol/fructose-specific phosphotransferase system IIA component (Ntr-type)
MSTLTHSEITAMFLALGLLLASARLLGETARRFNLPSVLGEIMAGVLWGPTVFGAIAPAWSAYLFPLQGGGALALDGLMALAITLFLLVAGLEVDLSSIWRQGKTAINVGIAGIVGPFAVGFAAAWFLPRLMGREAGADPLIFSLFMATALSITALPVIAKTLMDLNLYRSDLGMLVVAAAVFNDLVGWIIFAVILGMLGTGAAHTLSIGQTIWLTLGFALGMLTVGRWLIHRILPWIHAHLSWPGGVLGFALSLALVSAAFTEWIGIHAIFGAFLAGVAIGDSKHLRERTRATIEQFVSFIFAPLFFASIGLKVNFLAHFDLLLVLTVLVIATLGKVLGCGLAGRLSGLARREALALGFGMNARGAMEIILGLLALKYGLIGERLFVALVVMALATSLMSGPLLQRVLHLKKPRRFTDFFTPRAFVNHLRSRSRLEAITELANAAAEVTGLDPAEICDGVLIREQLMATGIGNGLAVPHARLRGLAMPVVTVGLSCAGIDFDAPDGTPAHVIFLILTPVHDDGAQLEILADIATTFKVKEIREQAVGVATFTEFLALVRSGQER